MELPLTLDAGTPRRRGVELAVRAAIDRGVLMEGMRLPSARALAEEWGVARGTVVAALDDLVAEGVLTARPRVGLFVARVTGERSTPRAEQSHRPPSLDLRAGLPEAGSFPAARWNAALRRASFAPATFDARGSLPLRDALAGYLGRARGVHARPEQILICSGFRTASSVLAATLAQRGARTVAIEDPSLPAIDRPWVTAGFHVLDLPVDERGAQVGHLDSRVDVAVLTPSHQFPLGGTLDPARRRTVLSWAGTGDRYVLEDDYDGEFRFDRRPVAALQRSEPARVIYAGTASKTLDPGLRLGWLVLPEQLVAATSATSEALTGGAPRLDQLALADLIRSGEYERHVRRQRREYGLRRVALRDALHRLGRPVPGIAAGLHAVIGFTDDEQLQETLTRLEGQGVAINDLSSYTRSAPTPPALVVGYGAPSRTRYKQALDLLARSLPPARMDGDDHDQE